MKYLIFLTVFAIVLITMFGLALCNSSGLALVLLLITLAVDFVG